MRKILSVSLLFLASAASAHPEIVAHRGVRRMPLKTPCLQLSSRSKIKPISSG